MMMIMMVMVMVISMVVVMIEVDGDDNDDDDDGDGDSYGGDGCIADRDNQRVFLSISRKQTKHLTVIDRCF